MRHLGELDRGLVVCHWPGWAGRQPEKRKVDSSILSLTTSFGLVFSALICANVG
jgi:hypothetical protein